MPCLQSGTKPPEIAREWRTAEIDECISHEENKVLGPATDLPRGFVAISTGLVYKLKRSGLKKARLIVHGYRMKAGVDFNETFAPVARVSSLRLLLAIACKYDLEIGQSDFKTAFLTAPMDTEVYVTLPDGFNTDPSLKQPKRAKTTHRLLKGVPGIPQGSRLFNDKLHKVLTTLTFVRMPGDYCVYRVPDKRIFLVVWVDDLIDFHDKKHQAFMDNVFSVLREHFKVKRLGDLQDLLGLRIIRDRKNRRLSIDQTAAIETLLKKAGMEDCRPVSSPIAAGTIFTKADCPQTDLEKADLRKDASWYLSVLATMIYIQTWTRPDLSFGVSKLCKFMHNPGPKHLVILKRVLRFLKGTKDRCLLYDFSSKAPRDGIYGYYDAAFADDLDTRRSTMAYIFFYEGCPISWKSKLHTYITTSTNHSEYCAAAKAAREAKFWHHHLVGLGFASAVSPIALFSDSTGAIAMAYNPVQHDASKHVDLADHYAREQVARGIITITHVTTNDMIADVLTKALSPCKFLNFVAFLLANGRLLIR
jgi:hypothetical protein